MNVEDSLNNYCNFWLLLCQKYIYHILLISRMITMFNLRAILHDMYVFLF